MKKIIFVFISCIVLLSNSLFAQNKEPAESNKNKIWGSGEVFKLDPLTDGLLLGSGTFIYGTELVFDKVFKLGQEPFSGGVLNLNDVNPFDRKFAQPYNYTIDKVCDGILITSFALPAVLSLTDSSEWLTCFTMYAETMLLAQGIKESIKLGVYRPRPYMYFDGWPEKDVIQDCDWANSFVSGHSTMSFAAATFTSYTFSKYFPDSPWRYAVTAGSYAMATTVALMRVAGGNHFVTDILCGAALGTACGFLVPWLHTLKIGKLNSDEGANVSLLPYGVLVTVNF